MSAARLEPAADGVATRATSGSVSETVERLRALIEAKGLKLFAVVDHSGEAAAAGLSMHEAKLLIFGSPAAGTPVMVAAPLSALDLPLKVLVWSDASAQVYVSYNDPSYLGRRYGLTEELVERLAGVVPLVDQAVTAT